MLSLNIQLLCHNFTPMIQTRRGPNLKILKLHVWNIHNKNGCTELKTVVRGHARKHGVLNSVTCSPVSRANLAYLLDMQAGLWFFNTSAPGFETTRPECVGICETSSWSRHLSPSPSLEPRQPVKFEQIPQFPAAAPQRRAFITRGFVQILRSLDSVRTTSLTRRGLPGRASPGRSEDDDHLS